MEMPKKSFSNKRMGDILIEQGSITHQQLKEALEIQKNGNNKRLGEIFVELGVITREELYEVLQYVYETEYVDLSTYVIDPEVISLIPEKTALRLKLLPISKNGDELIVAMANPLDVYAIDFALSLTPCTINIFTSCIIGASLLIASNFLESSSYSSSLN